MPSTPSTSSARSTDSIKSTAQGSDDAIDKVLKQVGPVGLKRIGAVYRKWQARNSKSRKPVSFSEWLDNYDAINKCMDRIWALEGKLYGEKVLKTAKSMAEFDRVREILHNFNKENAVSDQPFTWGESRKYKRIKNECSLKTWLITDEARKVGLGPHVVDDFEVVQVESGLVTVCSNYKGGLGGGSFWIPGRKYKKTASVYWRSQSDKETDPRLRYVDPSTGEGWTHGAAESRKRKLPLE